MTTRIRAPWGNAGSGKHPRLRLLRPLRASCPGPAGLLLAIAIAGCSGGSTAGSPTAVPTPTAAPSPRSRLSLTPIPTPILAPTPGFSETGSMATAREFHTATLLSDGRVLIAGGQNLTADMCGAPILASAELYDPATGTFSPTGPMASARESHTETLLTDGRVLIAGGVKGGLWTDLLASAELYDPSIGTFKPTGSMTTARELHTATLLSDGRVLIAGGTNRDYLTSAELYDPSTGTFSPTGSMTTARSKDAEEMPTATLLSDGRVLIAGGKSDRGLASAELYDPRTGTFSPTGSMTVARAGHTATLLSDGRVLIAGGWSGASYLASAELYDPATGTFSPTGSMTTARFDHTATLLSDGRVLLAGGQHGLFASVELYDPATGTFSAAGSMTTAREYNSATLLSDGRVLIAGGRVLGATIYCDDPSGPKDVASAELYRP